jgi:hypothetical protein
MVDLLCQSPAEFCLDEQEVDWKALIHESVLAISVVELRSETHVSVISWTLLELPATRPPSFRKGI